MKVQLFSRDDLGSGDLPASMAWVGAGLSVPPLCTGTIGDFVWNDTDRDGIQDAGELGIPNVKLLLKLDGKFGGTTPGALTSSAGEGFKFGTAFTLSEAGTGKSFFFFSAGGGSNQKFTPVIYAADGFDNPTNLVAIGAEVTVPAGQPAGWVKSALPAVSLLPGKYVLGLLAGPTSTGATNFFDPVMDVGVFNANPYPTPSNPWGAINHEDNRWSFYVTYTPSGGGATIGMTTTDAGGLYLFSGVCAGSYSVVVDATTVPAGFAPSPCNVGNDALDNDCSPATVSLPNNNTTNLTIDFGYHSGGGGKTFTIGPSSMEGHLTIRPGDWISGGYSFKFKKSVHLPTSFSVTSSMTLAVTCPQGGGSGGTIHVDLGAKVFAIPANNTSWLPTGDANSVLSWSISGSSIGIRTPKARGTSTASIPPIREGTRRTFAALPGARRSSIHRFRFDLSSRLEIRTYSMRAGSRASRPRSSFVCAGHGAQRRRG